MRLTRKIMRRQLGYAVELASRFSIPKPKRLDGFAHLRLQGAKFSGHDPGLAGQERIQFGVVVLGTEQVMGVTRDWLGNQALVFRFEKDRHEPLRPTFRVVNGQGDELSFKVYPFALVRLFVAAEAAVVGFGANRQDEIGPIESVQNPAGRAFGWRAGHVLIELGVDALQATVAPLQIGSKRRTGKR